MKYLLNCPFCGGNCITVETDDLSDGVRIFAAVCHGCFTKTGWKDTEEQAIAAWNTRVERTCHAELNEGRNAVVCSECGSSMLLEGWEEMKDWGGNTLINTFKTYPYCPNCGSKVMEE